MNIAGLERYEVLEELGQGASAKVFRVRHGGISRDFALKLFLVAVSDHTRRQFEIERQILAGLPEHPNVMQITDGGFTEDGSAFLVMQLCPGGSLADLLRRTGPLDTKHVIRIGTRMVEALQAVSTQVECHGDIKPENILISRSGDPVLSDFGIARVIGADRTMGERSFTPNHVAPDIFRGKDRDLVADLYSLGSTLFTLLTGHPPHLRPGEDFRYEKVMLRVLDDPTPELPSDLDVPKSLRRVLRSILEKDRERRASDLNELLRAFRVIENECQMGGDRLALPLLAPEVRGSSAPGSPSAGASDGARRPSVSASDGTAIVMAPQEDGATVLDARSAQVAPADSAPPARQRAALWESAPASSFPAPPTVTPSPPRAEDVSPVTGDLTVGRNPHHVGTAPEAASEPHRAARPTRAVIGGVAAALAIVAGVAGASRLAQGNANAPGVTTPPIAVEETPLLALRRPRIQVVRQINAGEYEVAWDSNTEAVHTIEVSRGNQLAGEFETVVDAPVGSQEMVVSGIERLARPCFRVIARDPSTDRVERSERSCSEASSDDAPSDELPAVAVSGQ